MVPIAFTSDHIETLHEMDLEYGEELGKEVYTPHVHRHSMMEPGGLVFERDALLFEDPYYQTCTGCSHQAYVNMLYTL